VDRRDADSRRRTSKRPRRPAKHIGRSYFMRLGLDRNWPERMWEQSILPYIEEPNGLLDKGLALAQVRQLDDALAVYNAVKEQFDDAPELGT
jgi:hypothetical protein